ncbi:anthranilate synthase component I family protein [Nesterenkonia sp. Act20]|uniref:anthranilate synthase component I family protein n=1 Tax=Nesterenkonia sp. Act20 TaxID=1483432 RepID=UPI001C45FA55|nr:anthranilate synthase component I family protein [Nesterenkonia sp. Act20]
MTAAGRAFSVAEAQFRSSILEQHEESDGAVAGTPGSEDLALSLFTALSALLPEAPAALLDSSDHAHTENPSRSAQSILAFSFGEHAGTVSHTDGVTTLVTTAGTKVQEQPFFSWLEQNWPGEQRADGQRSSGGQAREQPESHEDSSDTPSFRLGWVGWLGYELKREAGSPVKSSSARGSLPTEEASLFRATHAVVLHHHSGELELQWLESASQDAATWPELVRQTLSQLQFEPETGSLSELEHHDHRLRLEDLQSRDSRRAYLATIEAAQREITAGNSYEICLTTAVTAALDAIPASEPAGSGVELFKTLRAQNRAPFTQFLRIGETEVASTSPERFLSISQGGTLRSEPIKGTRPRGRSTAEDRRLAEDLATHPKDRAENVMIADLVRNDLSIHAIPGSLRTERLCAVESYPTVHQLVSTISARIPAGTSRARVIADAFPPGSMTGAPKISTMDILERLESGARGPYSGVAGYFSSNGAADLAVLIRTAVLTGGTESRRLHLGLGGAITADSDPEQEWEEVKVKSRGVLAALGAQFPESGGSDPMLQPSAAS